VNVSTWRLSGAGREDALEPPLRGQGRFSQKGWAGHNRAGQHHASNSLRIAAHRLMRNASGQPATEAVK
jgi:hypothetical protein